MLTPHSAANAKKTSIMFASFYAGFRGPVERWVYHTAKTLRENGFTVRGSFRKTVRGSEKFLNIFDSVGALEGQAAESDLVLLNKIPELPLLKRALACFPEKLTMVIHDHDYYCPRRLKNCMMSHKYCNRPYQYFLCGLCGMCVRASAWHGGFFRAMEEKFLTFPLRYNLFKTIPRFAVLSPIMRENLIRCGIEKERIFLLPPYLTIPRVEHAGSIDGGPPVILFTGPMIYGKGGDKVLHILSKLKQPYRARLLGDGKDWDAFVELSKKLKIRGNVEFPGWQLDRKELFRTSDIAFYPYREQETFNFEGAIAASYGLPIIATKAGGTSEFVADGQTGFLLDCHDEKAIIEKLELLLTNVRLRRQMGEAGRFYVTEQYPLEGFLKGFHDLAASKSKEL